MSGKALSLVWMHGCAGNANKCLTCNPFYETIFEVMRDEMNNDPNEMTAEFCSSVGGLNPDLDDFGVTHASQDDVDYEQEELGTKLEEGWFEEGDEETTDMSQLSPAFREIFNEYPEDEEDDDDE